MARSVGLLYECPGSSGRIDEWLHDDEFRERLIAAIERHPGPYWLSWQDALEALVDEHRLCGPDELIARAAAVSAHTTG